MDKNLENRVRSNFEEALKGFDFVKAGNIMDYLNWCWGGDSYPPSHEKIIEMIKELFSSAIESFENDYVSCNSGGFSVIIFKGGEVGIQFIPVKSYS